MSSQFAKVEKPKYVRKTGISATASRIVTPRPPVVEDSDECPVGFSEMMFRQSDGCTVGLSFPRKASPITQFEESFILGPRHS